MRNVTGKRIRTAAVAVAVCGLLIPSSGVADRPATAGESLAASRPVDITLDARQSLRGYVVDHAGKVQPSAPVYLFRDQRLVATELTGTGGEFVVENLRGGTYQLAVGERVLHIRCWASEVSPPHAQRSLLVSVADVLVTISDFPDYIDASGGQVFGAFVVKLAADSKSAKCGFKNGDTIVRVGSTTVRTLDDFNRALKNATGSVTCKVFRGYQHYDLTIEP